MAGMRKDYRVTVKVRNNNILNAIKNAGGVPGAKWCAENGLEYGRVNALINLTASPLLFNGELRPLAQKLCDAVGALPDELWSAEQLHRLEKNFSEMEMDHAQIVSLLPSDMQYVELDTSELEQHQMARQITKAMEGIGERAVDIIKRRFEGEQSYQQIADELHISTERVRQIEMKVLHILRRPHHAQHIEGIL